MFENGSDKYSIDDYFPTENGKSGWWYRTKVKIPKNLECEHCVLQWRYHTGTFARWSNLWVVQTQAILCLKSMSEKLGSGIERL